MQEAQLPLREQSVPLVAISLEPLEIWSNLPYKFTTETLSMDSMVFCWFSVGIKSTVSSLPNLPSASGRTGQTRLTGACSRASVANCRSAENSKLNV